MSENFPDKSLIAMIGLRPLPGSPGFDGSEQRIIERALNDVEIYTEHGVDALLIENSADLPYTKPPLEDRALEVVEHIAKLVRAKFNGPVGIQLLEAANEQAMQAAASAKLNFIRAEGYVFAHIGGAGLIEGCAGKLLRLRKQLDAEGIRVFADVRKKHCSHALTADLPISEHVRQAEFFKTDGIIVTGPRTGAQPDLSDLDECGSVTDLPILIGSGMTVDNLNHYFGHADGFIVGSTFREGGKFLSELSPERVEVFANEFRRLKSAKGNG